MWNDKYDPMPRTATKIESNHCIWGMAATKPQGKNFEHDSEEGKSAITNIQTGFVCFFGSFAFFAKDLGLKGSSGAKNIRIRSCVSKLNRPQDTVFQSPEQALRLEDVGVSELARHPDKRSRTSTT